MYTWVREPKFKCQVTYLVVQFLEPLSCMHGSVFIRESSILHFLLYLVLVDRYQHTHIHVYVYICQQLLFPKQILCWLTMIPELRSIRSSNICIKWLLGTAAKASSGTDSSSSSPKPLPCNCLPQITATQE